MSHNRNTHQDWLFTSVITSHDLDPDPRQPVFPQQTFSQAGGLHNAQDACHAMPSGQQSSSPPSTADVIIKVDWHRHFPTRWRVRLQKALRNWARGALSGLVGEDCYVICVQLCTDEHYAQIQITPSKAVDTLERMKSAILTLKDFKQDVTVHFLDYETSPPQKTPYRNERKSAAATTTHSSAFSSANADKVNKWQKHSKMKWFQDDEESLFSALDLKGGVKMTAAAVIGQMMDGAEDLKPKKTAVFSRDDEDEECGICLENFTNKETLRCGDHFCRECLSKSVLSAGMTCPECKSIFWQVEGNQPQGTMTINVSKESLPGHDDCGTIEINYFFPAGIQAEKHPHPGRPYVGTRKRAFLPDNEEGQYVLRLLQKAFDQKLIFAVRPSTTFYGEDAADWNDISHKTSRDGGPQCNGYPDPDYLKTVKEDLKALGVTLFDRSW